jgi:anion-transporting  ArsA/GET3 family ATPase
MPATALEWVRALLATVLKYRAVIGLGDFAADLVDISRDLRRLGELLRDPAQTRFVAVTRPAELPRRETLRLLTAITRLGLTVPAIVVNAVTGVTAADADARGSRGGRGPAPCRRCTRAAAAEADEIATLTRAAAHRSRGRVRVVVAPVSVPPPEGVHALEAWSAQWSVPERAR